MDEEIIFVFGPARGGTTFVNNLLDEWFSVGTGPEGTFISEIVQYSKKLGDLSNAGNRQRLAEAISKAAMFEIIRSRWSEDSRFDVTPEDILQRMKEPSVGAAIYAAFKSVADYRIKDRVGNKNPNYWRQLPVLHEMFPSNAKYVFVMRDGRDVALSLRYVPWGGKSVYEAARDWARMVQTVGRFRKELPDNRILTVSYERLLQYPGDTIDDFAHFLGVSDQIGLRERYEDAARQNELRNNFDKWRTEMSLEDQEVFEAVAGGVLSECGYERRFPNAKLGATKIFGYELLTFLRRIRVTVYHSFSKLPINTGKWKPAWLSARIVEMVQPGASGKKKRQ